MENIKIITFTLIFSLIFPVFGYSLTVFGYDPASYDTTLDPESLMEAGISLGNAEPHNITYNGGWQIYDDFNNTRYRVQWTNATSGVARFRHQSQGIIGRIMNTWLFISRQPVKGVETGIVYDFITNDTMALEWNSNYNWSRFIVVKSGLMLFYQPPHTSDNITDAIYNDGRLTLTIGEALEFTEALNFRKFISWYSSLIVGDRQYGLPVFFSWITRIMAALTTISIIALLRELAPF